MSLLWSTEEKQSMIKISHLKRSENEIRNNTLCLLDIHRENLYMTIKLYKVYFRRPSDGYLYDI